MDIEKIAALLEEADETITVLERENNLLKQENYGLKQNKTSYSGLIKKEASENNYNTETLFDDDFENNSLGRAVDIPIENTNNAESALDNFLSY